ncbi:conserved hypothetical protein [Gluconacetobacter diazotrophicus PA1 5]|uniref:Uncharacterized protein n=2 Tax=Gluconacetobacter diazotrophicus TaxID=33996 RepID=A0A7W4FEY8_GLUDI|nr:T-complex 10 C-terminal domain-containing protein [Gluconacetobacter diazotrophicus]ACI49938.1 conserved hypothetical protein [Gluconacetobacter diazotrophicus PA1 5]MBB2156489.1 hypothetical protein [Gluconacetobacter diazotrophicus]TWB05982.1 hypothetical protein FBZ86_11455 [Gluconacetobacter diazotrophicus]CAP55859.1 putative exported protein [Gluconacetobacter diazotrophicus PA1 5]
MAYQVRSWGILAILVACATVAAPVSRARAGSFIVVDGRADAEISETSRFYIDDQLMATIRLDATVPQRAVRIETPEGRLNHTYVLCGEITVRMPDGRVETHEVNGEGVLHHPDGHTLNALGTRNFTEFYLADPEDPTVVEHHPGRSSLCTVPTS